MTNQPPQLYLEVNVRSRKKSYFTGSAASLTSLNDKGEFDILPQHANFISLIKDYITLGKGAKEEQKFTISTGVLRVERNKVDVFLNV